MSRMIVINRAHLHRASPWLCLCFALLSACSKEKPARDTIFGNAWTAPDAGEPEDDESGGLTTGQRPRGECRSATSSEKLQAREVVMSEKSATGAARRGMTIADLYGKFVDNCGRCHTNGRNQGGFDVSLPNFGQRVTGDSLSRMRSDDPKLGMPQPFKAYSERAKSDPVVVFASELDEWLKAGKPEVFFPSSGQAASGGGASPYLLSRKVGMELTNLGNCIPNAAMSVEAATDEQNLDELFANVERFEDLPKSLSETDLSTLDSAELARHGVYAFAPAYTLWADYAKKTRYVRVPRGESIRFDEDAQTFAIPTNTRFYKTFMKEVTDLDGNKRYRKMETRIILSRPDRILDDGSAETTAIFGSYKWNEAETEATLNSEPYTSDNKGFKDDIFTYTVDERLEDKLVREAKTGEQLLAAGARRNYAIPGSDRCVHCHMGAPNQSFILGFTPLQIMRRPEGEGGVFEPAGPDELNQLERLIAYGVISNLASPDSVLPLEKTQGDREPRNEHELKAQGYMLGNCAHCHNPRGFPSVREKVLADGLDFWPSQTGGIFQFPLDKFSPRTFRGAAQDVRIPYITPSLFDMPPKDPLMVKKKWIGPTLVDLEGFERVRALTDQLRAAGIGAPELGMLERLGPGRPLLAPWRSLIYRNVDAPASYEDDGTVFPHMPMDTPGYDCRARRLLGAWMVSIPARYIGREVPSGLAEYAEMVVDIEQPFVEAKPSDRGYQMYLKQTEERLRRFQASERYHDCPKPELDVVAPEVASGLAVLPIAQHTKLQPEQGEAGDQYILSSPARPHYTRTDLHDDPIWIQRRSDWFEVLVTSKTDPGRADGDAKLRSAEAIKVVNQLRVGSSVRKLALEPVPFGLWKVKEEACQEKLASQPKASAFTGDERPDWMDALKVDPEAPVYMVSRGEQIFNAVCGKCHGAEANGVSALANTMADLTGGKTRVANLRDGLFGPKQDPGASWRATFAKADGVEGATTEDWVARYVAWMGLGGTNALIPSAVLTQIGSSSVLGEKRRQNFAAVTSASDAANMLTVVRKACEMIYGFAKGDVLFDVSHGGFRTAASGELKTLDLYGLIGRNGDADLWRAVCEFENPRFVTAVRYTGDAPPKDFDVPLVSGLGGDTLRPFIRRESYPAGADVGDHTGHVVSGIAPPNLAPWCVFGSNAERHANLSEVAARLGRKLPVCPEALLDRSASGVVLPTGDVTLEERNEWATRGAANAGMLVFQYLDALAKGEVKPTPAYDRCEELP